MPDRQDHLAIALGLAACRERVGGYGFFTAAGLVNSTLEEAQKQYQLERFLAGLDRLDLLICDELGIPVVHRQGGAVVQVFADRYERGIC